MLISGNLTDRDRAIASMASESTLRYFAKVLEAMQTDKDLETITGMQAIKVLHAQLMQHPVFHQKPDQ